MGARRDFILRHIDVPILDIDHFPKWHHRDAELLLMFRQQSLRRVWSVEGPALPVCAGAGGITTNDAACASVILADARVPEGFAWASHPHTERKEDRLDCVWRI